MKAVLISLLLILSYTIKAQISQEKTEIWGYPKEFSEKEFIDYLNENGVTACNIDLAKIGYNDAHVLRTFNNGMKFLITLRDIPQYSFNPIIEKSEIYPPEYVRSMSTVGVTNPENYYAYKAFIPYSVGDTTYLNSLNSNLNKRLVNRIFGFIKSQGKALNQDSCLYFMKHSNDVTFKQAALQAYMGSINNKSDIVKLFPLIMDNHIGDRVVTILPSSLKYYEFGKDDWNDEMYILSLNHPNVFLVNSLMSTYLEHNFPKEYAQKVFEKGSITIKEILMGDLEYFPEFENITTKFLTYLTGKEYDSKNEWLDYIERNTLN